MNCIRCNERLDLFECTICHSNICENCKTETTCFNCMSVQDIYEKHVISEIEKQIKLAMIIGAGDFELDLKQGIFRLGDGDIPIQFIGTYSYESSSFLWGWSNPTQIPIALKNEINRVKSLCPNIPEIQSPFNIINHSMKIPLVCKIISKYNCIYRVLNMNGDTPIGEVFIMFNKNIDHQELPYYWFNTIIEVIRQEDCDVINCVRSYLDMKDIEYEYNLSDSTLRFTFNGQEFNLE